MPYSYCNFVYSYCACVQFHHTYGQFHHAYVQFHRLRRTFPLYKRAIPPLTSMLSTGGNHAGTGWSDIKLAGGCKRTHPVCFAATPPGEGIPQITNTVETQHLASQSLEEQKSVGAGHGLEVPSNGGGAVGRGGLKQKKFVFCANFYEVLVKMWAAGGEEISWRKDNE